MDALRLFLAIDIPPFEKEKIAQVQNQFRNLDMDATWVKPANIHLTLKFLGNTDSRDLPGIKEHILNVVKPINRFSVSLGEVGVFPNTRKPRVLWVDLQDPENNLSTLQKMINEAAAQLGFPTEPQPFTPHLTFGRIKSSKGKTRLCELVKNIERMKSDPFDVSSVRLYQSRLTPKGAVYTVLEDFPLRQPVTTN